MTQKKRSKLGLPLLLGAITFALILLALWPKETPTAQVVVAARDLGAGALLTPADLTTITIEAARLPWMPVSDPSPLVGQSLAVVRFSGEPVTPVTSVPPWSCNPMNGPYPCWSNKIRAWPASCAPACTWAWSPPCRTTTATSSPRPCWKTCGCSTSAPTSRPGLMCRSRRR